ncbi:MAG: AmmeMemoRadiSam system radical SAM enzyme [Lentisphaerae bacterium]|jgi:pyruvate formate lyase activating enzyme|nr:AmmeMemoRadiSam system radical SAM enzyme [Lentisphaerota bacterium]
MAADRPRQVLLWIAAVLFLVAVVGVAAFWVYAQSGSLTEKPVTPATTAPPPADNAGLHEARWYDKLADGMVMCKLCPNFCRLSEGQIGFCRVRQNIGGTLYAIAYGKVAAAHVDPIEKKPFFHVLPGTRSFSIATPGCNLRCLFCQNWEIAQHFPWEINTRSATPEEIIVAALQTGSRSIAFTYSEPTIFYEYMYDIAKLAKAHGLKTVVISAGYINPEPLEALLPYIDAYKIDFKGFDPDYYTRMTGARRDPVLETMKNIRKAGVWLEVVNLLVPGHNDREEDVRPLAQWVRDNLGDDVPLHFSRFHPMHKLLNLPPTPVENVLRARQIALEEGLKFVYVGNIPSVEGASTYSPRTGELVIERKSYHVTRNLLKDGVAPDGEPIPGVWQ